jgi:glycosyltransferase involved in cell wall biosynthesis
MNGWEEGDGPYLWLAGVGVGSPPLQAVISETTLSSSVRLDPELDEAALRAAYLGAKAMAYVSTSEGFGLPLLEALAAGVPVVSANGSSLPEVGGDAVLYTDPQDELAMSEALARVWNDEDLRRTLVERGRQRVAEFSWDATAKATVEAYYDVLRFP